MRREANPSYSQSMRRRRRAASESLPAWPDARSRWFAGLHPYLQYLVTREALRAAFPRWPRRAARREAG